MGYATNTALLAPGSDPTGFAAFNARHAVSSSTPGTDSMALVEVEIVTRSVQEINRRRRVNLSGQVGTLGGLINKKRHWPLLCVQSGKSIFVRFPT